MNSGCATATATATSASGKANACSLWTCTGRFAARGSARPPASNSDRAQAQGKACVVHNRVHHVHQRRKYHCNEFHCACSPEGLMGQHTISVAPTSCTNTNSGMTRLTAGLEGAY